MELDKYREWKFGKVRDALVKDVIEIVIGVANGKSLVAGFITEDNELKLSLADPTDIVAIPIDVQPLVISLPFSELRTISDELNLTVADILDEALADMLVVNSSGNRHKICRESDFKEFDEIFEIMTEED